MIALLGNTQHLAVTLVITVNGVGCYAVVVMQENVAVRQLLPLCNNQKVTELPEVNLGQQKSKRKSPGKGFSFAFNFLYFSTSCYFNF